MIGNQMPDLFISYSLSDKKLANFMESHLRRQNISIFMASISTEPGQDWSDEIWSNLHKSTWGIFLASRDACQSLTIQQELSYAMAAEKKIIPILLDMFPDEIPGWIMKKHPLDARSCFHALSHVIIKLANLIKVDKKKIHTIVSLIVLGVACEFPQN
jgi:hypothetical protein